MTEKKKNIGKKVQKKQEEKISLSSSECEDKLCPVHGKNKLKLRGRTFEGNVIKKFHERLTISFERMKYIPKYERYEKRKTKLHAKLPKCMEDGISIGDLVKIAETRPISKTIHFIVVSKVEKKIKEIVK